MAGADQNIALMDGTYFVGRKEILDWINSVCGTSLQKVEQTCTGAIACQILDAMYPGKVPMSRVDWSANKDYEYINNYKILQKCFMNLKIDKHIEVDRLVRGKYQDNLEFMQWFKKFYELNASGQPYDPFAQRDKGKGGAQYTSKFGGGAGGGASTPTSASPTPAAGGSALGRRPTPGMTRTSSATAKAPGRVPPAAPSNLGRTSKLAGPSAGAAASTAAAVASNSAELAAKEKQLQELAAANDVLTNENGELRAHAEGLEKERDFYFGKLRHVEVLLQEQEQELTPEANALAQEILKILYATGEEAEVMEGVDEGEPMAQSPPPQQ